MMLVEVSEKIMANLADLLCTSTDDTITYLWDIFTFLSSLKHTHKAFKSRIFLWIVLT